MKKVLIVFNHPAPYKVRLFNELSKYFDLHVIFERNKAKDRSNSFYFEQNYSFKIHNVKGLKLGRENFISNKIVKHVKQNQYDLIIMNGYSQFAELKTIKYLHQQNIPYVLYINGGIINQNESKFKKNLKTKYISGAKAYISPDKQSNKYLIYYGAKEENIFNYPYSTIYEKEIGKEENKENLRKELDISYNKVFVSSGQLIKRKNYFSLVKEWSKFPENYGLYLFGDGKEKKRIEKFINENKVKNVVLKGFVNREKMLNFFKACDAFLFPSNEDIYGHVINEAMSQGLPVISTNKVNSAVKLIKNKENGFVLDSLNGDEFKQSVEYLLTNDLSENCLKTAKENTIEKMVEEHVKIIEGIIEK